jgi:hypothetical protein
LTDLNVKGMEYVPKAKIAKIFKAWGDGPGQCELRRSGLNI